MPCQVKVLIEEGKGEVDVLNRYGDTALDEARAAQAQAVVEYLEGCVTSEAREASKMKFLHRRADQFLRAASGGDAKQVTGIRALFTGIMLYGCSSTA